MSFLYGFYLYTIFSSHVLSISFLKKCGLRHQDVPKSQGKGHARYLRRRGRCGRGENFAGHDRAVKNPSGIEQRGML